MRLLTFVALLLEALPAGAASKPPVYIWLEPEWFDGVAGSFSYWSDGTKPQRPTGNWGVAGPGISAEWTQGGESEWNSMGASAAETKAQCHRVVTIPRGGKYRVWVRYVDHRKKTEPFTVALDQGGKLAFRAELGVAAVVPPNDEYQLYWGFSFGWGSLEGELGAGPAKLMIAIDKAGEAWRQVDAVLITDDLDYTPVGREKPPFAYLAAFDIKPKDGSTFRGSAKNLKIGESWQRPQLAGRDFTMWTGGLDGEPKWWEQQDPTKLTRDELLFQFGPPTDIRKQFHAQFAGQKNIPVLQWPGLVQGMYLGSTPDLSPDTPLRKYLDRTKAPFYILTNYASGAYTEKNGPATYKALEGPLKEQFLGYIHGEALGTGGVSLPEHALGKNRREHLDLLGKELLKKQMFAWTKIYKTPVAEAHMAKSISCLSVDSIALAHQFHEIGAKVVGYEEDSTNVHVPMRIAFERGAARQYGNAWINYASGNFGDACNYFTQEPVVPRGAKSWFHSKYAVTDGVTASWYRKMYYLNYLGGASAIFWEQNLGNQWHLPGPGTHPIQLSPFGRATEDFMAFVDRLPDRGEPFTPIALLLSYGHAYERVNYSCKMLHVFPENRADLELRELFNVMWHPSGVVEGLPAAPDLQSLPNGRYGNLFDVLVDRPGRAKAIFDYPIVWAAGDVVLDEPWQKALKEYVEKGGTLVLGLDAAKQCPRELTGLQFGKEAPKRSEKWGPIGDATRECTPFEVETCVRQGAEVLASADDAATPIITRNKVGEGAVIVTLMPGMMGLDERAHPALPYLMNGLTANLLPVEVRLANSTAPGGEIMYQLNKTKDGWLVALVNNRGLDKTQNGVARVDRRAFVDVVLKTKLPVASAKELTTPRDLQLSRSAEGVEVKMRIHPGDVQVVYFTLSR